VSSALFEQEQRASRALDPQRSAAEYDAVPLVHGAHATIIRRGVQGVPSRLLASLFVRHSLGCV